MKKPMWTCVSSQPQTKILKKRLPKDAFAKTFITASASYQFNCLPSKNDVKIFRCLLGTSSSVFAKAWRSPSKGSRRKPCATWSLMIGQEMFVNWKTQWKEQWHLSLALKSRCECCRIG